MSASTRLPLLVALLWPMTAPAVAQTAREPEQRKSNATALKPVEIAADGTEVFRALLDRAGVKPVPRREVERGRFPRYDDMMIIVLGNSADRWIGTARVIEHVHTVINNGGAALIAADTAFHLGFARNAFGESDWAIIEPARVVNRAERHVHNGREYCPYVVPVTAEDFPGLDADSPVCKLFCGLTRVATNDPAYLHVRGLSGEWRYPLARFPPGSFVTDPNGLRRPRALPLDALFAVGGDGPDLTSNNTGYQFVALADHSVFINQMLIEPDTDNLELAHRLIDYLKGPALAPEAKRNKCIFIENGEVIDRFDSLRRAFAGEKPAAPLPSLNAIQEKLVDLVNNVADDIQTRDVLNSLILNLFSLPAIVRLVLVATGVYATIYILRRAFASRKPQDQPPPPVVAGVSTGPPEVFDRRRLELLRRNNLYEPVRDLVRDFFTSIGVVEDTTDRKPPPIFVSSTVKRPESLRQAFQEFWKLAFGPPRKLALDRWQALEPYFDRLRQAHAEGKWGLLPGPG
jgi:hypothetical protein